MKKTSKRDTKQPKLVVRTERLRKLDTEQLDQVIGGFNAHSIHTSCC